MATVGIVRRSVRIVRRRYGWFGDWYRSFGGGTDGSAVGTGHLAMVRIVRRLVQVIRRRYASFGGRYR
ncbi:MAG: hypothetical protein KDJ65_17820 [Anaerolineae bacterium]|nr:hypothetical protein [Anaerolineae bacterium]